MTSCNRRNAILLMCLLSLNACGFSLRSGQQLQGKLPALQLNLQQPGSELAVLLQRSLRSAGVNLLDTEDSGAAGVPVLSLEAENFASRPVSVNPRAQAAQYELLMSVNLSLRGVDGMLIEPDTLSVERLFFENLETITGNLEEMQVIRSEMRRELVDHLLRRLDAAVR